MLGAMDGILFPDILVVPVVRIVKYKNVIIFMVLRNNRNIFRQLPDTLDRGVVAILIIGFRGIGFIGVGAGLGEFP